MSAETQVVRHVPWKCQWGAFGGVPTPDAGGKQSRTASGAEREWSPWTCQHPQVHLEGGYVAKGDCEVCPFWTVRLDRAVS